jgi:hypothetical protein
MAIVYSPLAEVAQHAVVTHLPLGTLFRALADSIGATAAMLLDRLAESTYSHPEVFYVDVLSVPEIYRLLPWD